MGRGVGFGFGVTAAGGGVAVAARRAGRVANKTGGVAVGKGTDTGSGKGDGIRESGAADGVAVAAGSAYRSAAGSESQAAGNSATASSATGSSRRYQCFPMKPAIAHPIVTTPDLASAQTGAANCQMPGLCYNHSNQARQGSGQNLRALPPAVG